MGRRKGAPSLPIYYHWAPRSRRNAIIRKGLMPGCWSMDNLWKPPYVCLGTNPHTAWVLSGNMPRGREVKEWDLWQAYLDSVNGYEELYFDNGRVKEVRVYERIYKRDLWLVGQRSNK